MPRETGAEHQVAQLAPGESTSLQTSPGHVFVARPVLDGDDDDDGKDGAGDAAAAAAAASAWRFDVMYTLLGQSFHLHDGAVEL